MTAKQLSRRSFVAAAAAGAVASISPRLYGAGPAAGSGATLRWGIIGTGTRGTFTHIPVLKDAPESQLVGLCDVSEERVRDALRRAGEPIGACTDYRTLLDNKNINAVVIATPNLFHREMLLAAIDAGKHVLCEKPIGVSADDAVAMKRAADSAKTVVMFGMQYRNNPRQQQIKELIASGRIGKPRYVIQNVSRGDWNRSKNVWQYADPKVNGGKPTNWRFSYAATGGTLNEFSCHYLDLLHWMVGEHPATVSCDGGIAVYQDGRDTWDHATVTMKYPSGVTAVHTLCMFGPGRNELVVMGDEGSIETQGEALKVRQRGGRGRGGGERSQTIEPKAAERRSADNATLRLYEDFLECVKAGKKPEAGAERAVNASKTGWLAEIASQRKAEVKWDALA